MRPQPNYGVDSYKGTGRFKDKKVLLTGGDSGIGRAVALAYAREGADLALSYLNEHDDAAETKRLVEGRQCLLVAGDISKAEHCRSLVGTAVEAFGRIDVLVDNAAHQTSFNSIEQISDKEWDVTLATNISAMFYITKAAVPYMKPGTFIINTASVNADSPSPQLLAYATTKGAIQNFTGGLAQLLAKRGIRANAVPPKSCLDASDPVHYAR